MEADIRNKYQNNGIFVMIIGFILFFIGLIAFSITETSRVNALGIEVELTTRPYGTIGAILIFLGIAAIIGGIAIKIFYSNNSKIFPPQYTQQYYQPPQQQYYQHPQQQYYQNPNQPAQQAIYCPNCKLPTGNQTNFCSNCGIKI